MKNKATIIRDDKGDIYLCIIGKPFTKPVYFYILPYANKPGKTEKYLCDKFEIDLKGGE